MPLPSPITESVAAALTTLLHRQQQAFASDLLPSRALRDERLARLDAMLEQWGGGACARPSTPISASATAA